MLRLRVRGAIQTRVAARSEPAVMGSRRRVGVVEVMGELLWGETVWVELAGLLMVGVGFRR